MRDDRSLDDLTVDIQTKRSEMYSIANQYGYSDERTLKNSQELDQLIVEYQNYMLTLTEKKSIYMKFYYCNSRMKYTKI